MNDRTTPVLRTCPHCDAAYRVVKAEADGGTTLRETTCLACGGPLQGREGRYVLKYFLVESRKAARAARRQARRNGTARDERELAQHSAAREDEESAA